MSIMQTRNPAMVRLLSGDFQRRYEPNLAWKAACAQIQALPGLRGFWPMSSFDEGGDAYDLSGQGRTLSYNGNPTYNRDGLIHYIDFDGTGDYLNRADEAGLDTLGTDTFVAAARRGMTVGGWFKFDVAEPAAGEHMMSKRAMAGDISWYMAHNVDGTVNFVVSGDCTALIHATSTGTTGTDWCFVAGRYDPSTEVAVFRNSEIVTTVAGVPAALCNNTTDLNVSGYFNGSALMAGCASLCFLCATALGTGTIRSLYQQSRALFSV